MNCGQTLPKDSIICKKCSKFLKICLKCGAEIPKGSKYCWSCGISQDPKVLKELATGVSGSDSEKTEKEEPAVARTRTRVAASGPFKPIDQPVRRPAMIPKNIPATHDWLAIPL